MKWSALLLFLVPCSVGAGECVTASGFDVCRMAREVQRALAANLPQQISQSVTYEAVFAHGNHLTSSIIWNYSEAEFSHYLRSNGMTRDALKTQLAVSARMMACGQKLPAEFINRGGVLDYIYKTNDNRPIANISVPSCR